MTRSALALVVMVVVGVNNFSQKIEVQSKADPQDRTASTFKPGTIELLSPWVIAVGQKTTFSEEKRRKSCFDFESLSYGCGRGSGVAYGDRIGVNLDLFQIHGGVIDRTRMVEIGKYNWTDKFSVPYVEPWTALAPGEKRAITINASGTPVKSSAKGKKGPDAVADMNGNGTFTPKATSKSSTGRTYATANVKEQISSTVKGVDGRMRNDPYTPNMEVKKGYMYAVHVVDQQQEYYVLIHVDDVVHGERVALSFIKILIGPM